MFFDRFGFPCTLGWDRIPALAGRTEGAAGGSLEAAEPKLQTHRIDQRRRPRERRLTASATEAYRRDRKFGPLLADLRPQVDDLRPLNKESLPCWTGPKVEGCDAVQVLSQRHCRGTRPVPPVPPRENGVGRYAKPFGKHVAIRHKNSATVFTARRRQRQRQRLVCTCAAAGGGC